MAKQHQIRTRDDLSGIGKELRPLVTAALDAGWRVVQRRNGHLTLYPPNSRSPLFTSSTPSDSRALHNIRSGLRQRGLAV